LSSFVRDIFITILVALLLFLGAQYSIQNPEVIGPSMQPALHTGERVLINKLAYRFGKLPHRGDIVVLDPPDKSSSMDYIKRIIGLPGESIELRGGITYVHSADGVSALQEPYVQTPSTQNYTGNIIPSGQYFVMGDNRDNSNDSRAGWTVPLADIVGKAWAITWPISNMSYAPNYALY